MYKFKTEVRDAFALLDLNGDGEVTKKEVENLKEVKWSPLKPGFVELVSDNFDLIANLQRHSMSADESISSDDVSTISDIYKSKTESPIFTEKAQQSLLTNSQIMDNGNFPFADQKWMMKHFHPAENEDEYVLRTFIVDNYEGIAGLDRTTVEENILFNSIISPRDISLMTPQAIAAGQAKSIYQADRAFGNDFEEKHEALDKFMNKIETIFMQQE